MKKDELKKELNKLPLIRIITYIRLTFMAVLISSPFIWIWFSGILAIKIGLTGFFGILIFYGISWILDQSIEKVADEYSTK
jgi:hypothetical protein